MVEGSGLSLFGRCCDGGFYGGVSDRAEGLGAVVLVALQFYGAEAVGVGINGQRGDGGVGTDGASGEALACWGVIG